MTLPDQIAAWLQEQLSDADAEGFVLGLSGGVDSATAAALAVRAVGPEQTLAALMPCHSQPEDAQLAQLMAHTFDIPTVTVSLDETFETLMSELPPSDDRLSAANVKPRLRMTTLYYLAQSHNYLVLGSGNKSELKVGYFTKYGDGGVDLLPLGDVYKTEVWEMARRLGVPQEIVERPPSAGLWADQTDEQEMGISYEDLDRILMAIEAEKTDQLDPTKLAKVEHMIASTAHKRATPPIYYRTQAS
jgi:NAD+ synthase